MMLEDDIKLEDNERQPCECWTRVMGYYRPIISFNIGKTQEQKDRKCYNEQKVNEKFNAVGEHYA